MLVRVLKVPLVGGKDKEDRGLGDDWLLADFGCVVEENGKEYCIYLTTDQVQGSSPVLDELEPEKLAKLMADTLNEMWERHKSGGGNTIKVLDVFRVECPTCGPEGEIDCVGRGEAEDLVWCEGCGWEELAGELMR